MSARGRSTSPRPLQDADVDMENGGGSTKPNAKVVIVTNLSRNVVEAHLQTIFGFYGQITKIDLPIFGKCRLDILMLRKNCLLIRIYLQLVKTEGKLRWNMPTQHQRTRLPLTWMAAKLTAPS